jgi:hypothetical protein
MPPYEVVEEQNFMEQIKNLKGTVPRIYDIKDGVCWILARNPKSGIQLPNYQDYRIYKTDSLNTDDQEFWILFKFEKGRVRLFSIAPVE